MQVAALIWGIIVMLVAIVAAIPFLGWLNWLNIPVSLCGVILSVISRHRARFGPHGLATAGVVLCSAAAILGAIRLYLGGGLL